MDNFWLKLPKNFLALAPMAGITDMPFRLMCTKFGADVVYSEMASAAALVYQPKKTLELVRSSALEAPLVIQVFGADPEHFAEAARKLSDEKYAKELGVLNYRKPAGLDINMGCPVSKVVKTGSGAMLFQDPERARACVQATLNNTDLPVSIKIRKAAGNVEAKELLEKLADLPVAALMIHGRSLAQGFVGEIDYEAIRVAKEQFNHGPIIVNGGIDNVEKAQKALELTGADGVGLARGVYGRPWLFKQIKEPNWQPTRELIFETILEHARLVANDNNCFTEFRKHLCWYVTGLDGAREMRGEAVKVEKLADVEVFVDKYK